MADAIALRHRYEAITVGSMYAGYAGLMLCRTAVTVASPEMIDDPALGLTEEGFGELVAYGAGGALAGKLVTGAGADLVGGRRLFLIVVACMGAITFAFGVPSSYAVFMLLNFALQGTKAGGWPAMAKLIAAWFSPGRHGRIWGIVSTSSRVSSMASHFLLGALLLWFPWRWVFYVAGTIAAVLVIGLYFTLKEEPAAVGLDPPDAQSPEPDAAASGSGREPRARKPWETTLGRTAGFFAASPHVWLICAAMMALTVQMEFQSFLPIYFKSSFDVEAGLAGIAAGAFPAGSLVSLLIGGVVYDRLPRAKRPRALGLLLVVGLGSVLVLRAVSIDTGGSSLDLWIAIVAIFVFGFAISPAYYIPMGVFSIEFGRSRSGVLIGIIDACGYGTAMVVAPMAGKLVFRIKESGGSWEPLITYLAAVSLASVALMTIFLFLQRHGPDDRDVATASG